MLKAGDGVPTGLTLIILNQMLTFGGNYLKGLNLDADAGRGTVRCFPTAKYVTDGDLFRRFLAMVLFAERSAQPWGGAAGLEQVAEYGGEGLARGEAGAGCERRASWGGGRRCGG